MRRGGIVKKGGWVDEKGEDCMMVGSMLTEV